MSLPKWKVAKTYTDILYHKADGPWEWPVANSGANRRVRVVINAALRGREAAGPSLKLRINTEHGLHVRPIAYLVRGYQRWAGRFRGGDGPTVRLRHDGKEADLGSLLDLLPLSVPPNGVCCSLSLELPQPNNAVAANATTLQVLPFMEIPTGM